MIEKLNLLDDETVKKILAVQIPAYEIEAELIDFEGIPQLKDTVESVRNSGETFYGFYENGTLIGCIAVENTEDSLDICRLVVHPSHFRKGVAKRLLEYILSKADKEVTVSTGSKNKPAIALYEKHGFQKRSEVEVAPNVFITNMFKPDPSRNNKAEF